MDIKGGIKGNTEMSFIELEMDLRELIKIEA